MRINPISMASVNFGSNKKARDFIEQESKLLLDDDTSKALLDYTDFVNDLEDNIDRKEKLAKNGSIVPKDLSELLVNFKDFLFDIVIDTFPDSEKYAKLEKDYYAGELKKSIGIKNTSWRNALYSIASSYLDNPPFDWSGWSGNTINSGYFSNKFADDDDDWGDEDDFDDDFTGISGISGLKQGGEPEKMYFDENSPKGFQDIKGMNELKRELKENVIDVVQNPAQAEIDFEEYGKKRPNSILLYGPPGCGKTFIVKGLAKEADTDTYIINSANVGSCYVNQTAKNIKAAFDKIAKQAEKSDKPIFVFMDEIESLVGNRSDRANSEDNKQVTTLLREIEDARSKNIIVIGATNKYDMIDPAIRRRFDMKRFVGLPDYESRMELIKNNLSKKAKAKEMLENEEVLDIIAKQTKGFSNHSINLILDEASMNAFRRDRADISLEDVALAIQNTNEEKINEKEYIKEENKKAKKIGFMEDIQVQKSSKSTI